MACTYASLAFNRALDKHATATGEGGDPPTYQKAANDEGAPKPLPILMTFKRHGTVGRFPELPDTLTVRLKAHGAVGAALLKELRPLFLAAIKPRALKKATFSTAETIVTVRVRTGETFADVEREALTILHKLGAKLNGGRS